MRRSTGASPSVASSRRPRGRPFRARTGSDASLAGVRLAGATHLILVNPSAGGGRAVKLLPELEAALRARGLEYRLMLTTSLEHGCEEARRAAAGGEIPVVMSGDGLIGQVGGMLAGSEVPMGVIPGGRGNDLARVLGIPAEIEGAVDLLAAG